MSIGISAVTYVRQHSMRESIGVIVEIYIRDIIILNSLYDILLP